MNKQKASELRLAAENVLVLSPKELRTLSAEETDMMVHELQVHQIELQMQNEELRQAQEALEEAREKYFNLYDLAPVGYFSLSEKGLVLEANLTAASLLGVARNSLAGCLFCRLIHPDDQDIYYLSGKKLAGAGQAQVCQVRLVRQDKSFFWARIESATSFEDGSIRVAVIDVTEQKDAAQVLEQAKTMAKSLHA